MKTTGSVAPLLGVILLSAAPASAQVAIGINVALAPPPLPVYAQPPLPGPDYIWTPGYWAWDDIDEAYYWVPGTWVVAPRPGLLWTPPWWGWSDGAYVFHAGYWGPHVGFYGGVPYGFGYTGLGFQGGYWNGGHVFYNRTVTNVTNVHVTNVYARNVVVNRITRVSYNGGPGGVQARPTAQDWRAAHDPHIAPTGHQQAHIAAAHADPQAFAWANHGRPARVATARPLVAARIAAMPMPMRPGGAPPMAFDGRARLASHVPYPPQGRQAGFQPYPLRSQAVRFAPEAADRPDASPVRVMRGSAPYPPHDRGAPLPFDRPPPAPHPHVAMAQPPHIAAPRPPHVAPPRALPHAMPRPAPRHQAPPPQPPHHGHRG